MTLKANARKMNIDGLDDLILSNILSKLPPTDIAASELVCKRWLQLSEKHDVWKPHAIRAGWVDKNANLPKDYKTAYLDALWKDKFQNKKTIFNKVKLKLPGPGLIHHCSVLGDFIAVADTVQDVSIWRIRRPIKPIQVELVRKLHHDEDIEYVKMVNPELLVAVGIQKAYVWHHDKLVRSWDIPARSVELESLRTTICCSCLVYDHYLAIGSSLDAGLHIFDIHTGQLIKILKFDMLANPLSRSPITKVVGAEFEGHNILIHANNAVLVVCEPEMGLLIAYSLLQDPKLRVESRFMLSEKLHGMFYDRRSGLILFTMIYPKVPTPAYPRKRARHAGCHLSRDFLLKTLAEANHRDARMRLLPPFDDTYGYLGYDKTDWLAPKYGERVLIGVPADLKDCDNTSTCAVTWQQQNNASSQALQDINDDPKSTPHFHKGGARLIKGGHYNTLIQCVCAETMPFIFAVNCPSDHPNDDPAKNRGRMKSNTHLPLGLGPSKALHTRRIEARRPRTTGITCSLYEGAHITSRVAGVLNGGAGKSLMVSIATVTPFLHHPANLLTPHASHAAFVTMASLFTATFSLGWAMYLGAKNAWESLEPWLSVSTSNAAYTPVTLYDVDVTGSRFFSRPLVLRAAHFAAEAHRGQVRKTREPYVTHCLETALIVERLLAPTEEDERAEAAVIAAILHDVVDDTAVCISEVEDVFGEQVASMVSKVSQLSQTNQLVRRRLRLEDAEQTAEEVAQLREMIITMVSEPLAIVIKLADRLHNMRTVYPLAPEKQVAVAQETRRVWCSLAERLGMFAIKSELEDLCFAILQPTEYVALRTELDNLWGITTIAPSDVMPSDCCLAGECDCGFMEDEEAYAEGFHAACLHDIDAASSGTDTDSASSSTLSSLKMSTRNAAENLRNAASAFPWLGAATALLPGVGASDASSKDGDQATRRRKDDTYSWLTPQQIEVKNMLDSVLPFDASTFNMERLNISPSARRGLEVLQGCAKALLYEITVEGVASGLDVSVQGRVKSLYSIFKKMARKKVPLSQVYDSRALRVVVDDENGWRERDAIAACYKLQPVVHRLWRKVSGEDDDYISQPKASGYQSLHTAVIGPGGIPMEVQIRTSTMHEVAEYGTAAHWAYKERSVSTAGAGSTGPEGITPGHPALQISAGNLKDAVVVRADHGGLRLLVAVNQRDRKFQGAGATKASPQEYSEILAYVEEKGYFQPGQGDLAVTLEMYTFCSDGKYHRIDQFGHKLPTTIVPLHRMDTMPSGSVDAPEHGNNTAGDSETSFMENRIRLLRSMLDWGADMERPSPETTTTTTVDASQLPALDVEGSDIEVAPLDAPAPAHISAAVPTHNSIMVLVWPSGKILQLPRGTTAGAVLRRERPEMDALSTTAVSSTHGQQGGRTTTTAVKTPIYVNVNNRLVPDETPLCDGDYVCTDGLERVKI